MISCLLAQMNLLHAVLVTGRRLAPSRRALVLLVLLIIQVAGFLLPFLICVLFCQQSNSSAHQFWEQATKYAGQIQYLSGHSTVCQ